MSEQQKKTSTPIWKNQNSKNTGERIANPDYVDPQKFILNSSRSSLVQDKEDSDTLERLDMTINENDVLTEIENRLQKSMSLDDTGQIKQCSFLSSRSEQFEHSSLSISSFNSSQNDDSYYESILDDNLVEEYVKNESGVLVLKQDSFRSTENKYILKQNQTNSGETAKLNISTSKSDSRISERRAIKRPNKAPPPIPVKPTHLKNGHKIGTNETIKTNIIEDNSKEICEENLSEAVPTKSWVKAMVGRFE